MSKWLNDVVEIRETKDRTKLFIKFPESLEDIDALAEYLKANAENGGAAIFLDKKIDKLTKSFEGGHIPEEKFQKWTALNEDGSVPAGSMMFIKYTGSCKLD